jgi:hypothetical protein
MAKDGPRHAWLACIAAASLLLASVAPAAAITNGTPSTDTRVGALGAIVPGVFDEPFFACSGTQISPQVFLTAAHCVEWADPFPDVQFFVTFDDNAYDPGDTPFDPFTRPLTGQPLLRATSYAYAPGYGHDLADAEDYGVVLFDGDDTLPGPYATLPSPGQLDTMKRAKELRGFVFDLVGYGAATEFGQGPPTFVWGDGSRQQTTAPYAGLTRGALLIQVNDQATEMGGTCFGDSGSPVLGNELSGRPNVVFSVTSWGDAKCRAISHSQRLDTVDAQRFLHTYCDTRNCQFAD